LLATERSGVSKIFNGVIHSKERDIIRRISERRGEEAHNKWDPRIGRVTL